MKLHNKHIQCQRGFTLIESLLTLYILTIITTLIIMLLSTLSFKTNNQAIHSFELENFVIQLQNELREANEWSVDSSSIQITSRYDKQITYATYKKMIRRQMNATGQEVMLYNVQNFNCIQLDDGIKLIITDTNGEEFVRNIYRLGE